MPTLGRPSLTASPPPRRTATSTSDRASPKPRSTVVDALSVDKGSTATTLTGGAASVLTNDTDAENDALTAALASGPSSGSLTLNPDGSFSYTHDGSGTVSDSFSYRASDGSTASNMVSVTITVSPVNAAPVPTLFSPVGYGLVIIGLGLVARRRL
jgi:VCBS repeat-containing protein